MALLGDMRQLAACQHQHDAPSCRFPTAPLTRHFRARMPASPRPQAASMPLQPTTAPSCSPRCSRSRLSVMCMAHPRRIARIASQVQKEVSNMFIDDQVVVKAITPERAGGATELSALASVTHVYVSNDLQVVKVYVSIYSDERGKQRAMNNLKRLEGYVRREMGQRVPLRLTPEYRFEYDDSMEEAELVARVIGKDDVERFTRELDEESNQNKGWAAATQPNSPPSGSEQGGQAAADDDDDGGFFDDDEVDEGQYVEYSSADVFKRPGPFDDLFGSVEPDPGSQGRGGRGGGQGGRGKARSASASRR